MDRPLASDVRRARRAAARLRRAGVAAILAAGLAFALGWLYFVWLFSLTDANACVTWGGRWTEGAGCASRWP